MGYFWENSSWKELSSPGHRDQVTFLEGSKIPVDMALGVMVSGGLGSAGAQSESPFATQTIPQFYFLPT